MVKKGLLFIAALVMVVAVCIAASADSGDGFPEAAEVLEQMFGTVYFVPEASANVSTDEYSVMVGDSDPTEVLYLSGERALSGSVEFVSGDESMKDLVSWVQDLTPGECGVCIIAHEFQAPGEAVFHISVNSKNKSLEQDYTLKVLSFPENAVKIKEGGEIRIEPGRAYTAQELLAMIATLDPELAEASTRYFMFHGAGNGQEYWLSPEEIGNFFLYDKLEMMGTVSFDIGNASFGFFDVKVGPEAFAISGPKTVYAGQTYHYEVAAVIEGTPVPDDFVLTAEGTELDAEGNITLADDAKPGEQFTLTAVSAQAEMTCTLVATVGEDPMKKAEWKDIEINGVTVPMMVGEQGQEEGPIHQEGWEGVETSVYGNSGGQLSGSNYWVNSSYGVTVYSPDFVPGTIQDMIRNIEWMENDWSQRNYDSIGRMYVNGYPFIYVFRTESQPDGGQFRTVETNGQMGRYQLNLNYSVSAMPGEGLPPLDVSFLTDAVSRIKVDGQAVNVLDHEPTPALMQENGLTEVSAGASVQYTAGEDDPTFGKLIWVITDEAGEKTKAATVDKKGVVKAAGNVKEMTKVVVKARYEYCSESATAELTIYPAVKKITILADGSYLYLNSNHTLLLKAHADPEDGKLIGLTWTVNKPELAEIKDNGDGTATLTPVAPGAVTVTVSDAAKKKATAKFTVTDQAVTEVVILAKGTAAAGKTVTLSATFTPEKPANKEVTWAIDVDETIATINAKGQLKIAKDAPSGTVITVTCTALGAVQPVDAKMELTVE